MLRIFPSPYPDELLYSIFARHHIRSGNKLFKRTIEDLLGYVPHQLYGLALPSNLSFFVKNLGLFSKQTSESLIVNHTLYPFYKSFLTQPEAFLLKDLMKKKAGKPIFQIARIAVTEKNENRQSLRFCDQCFEEDLQQYGEAYWHRMHQIPGVLVCLTHGTILRSLVLTQEGYLNCYAADLESCSIEPDEAPCREDTLQQLLTIAEDIVWLSNSDFSFKGLQWLRSRYQHYLVEKEFGKTLPSKTFKFDGQKFVDAVFSFYGSEYWSVLKPGLDAHAEQSFTHCLLACDIMPTMDRVTHISLIRFLSNSLQDFFKE